MGVENGIFCSEIGSGFGDAGGTPPPKIPRSTPPGGSYKALEIWLKHFSEERANGSPYRSKSWQGSLYINHLSYPSFLNSFIERFRIFFDGVTLKPDISRTGTAFLLSHLSPSL